MSQNIFKRENKNDRNIILFLWDSLLKFLKFIKMLQTI